MNLAYESLNDFHFTGESQSLKNEANKNAFKQLETQMNNTNKVNKQKPANKPDPQESNPSERYDGKQSSDFSWS